MRVFSFDDLDGLTLREIETLLGLKKLKFGLNQIFSYNKSGLNYRHLFFIVNYALDLKDLEVSDKRIDKLVEEKLTTAYQNASEEEKKIFNSFFKRYQDRTHKNTVNRTYRMRGLRNDN